VDELRGKVGDAPTVSGMLISAREAARILADLPLDREAVRRLLLAGFAGPVLRAGGASLYDEQRVTALLDTPLLDWPLVTAAPPAPTAPPAAASAVPPRVLVARVGPRRPVDEPLRAWAGADLAAPIVEQRDGARMFWRISPLTRLELRLAIEQQGAFPFVATVSGFVALGADIVAVHQHARGTVLELADPSEWFHGFAGHRLSTPGGSPWLLWPPTDPVPRRRRRPSTRWLQQWPP